MTQHDFEFADQLFPAMRTDMNNAMIALSTRQAGTGAPALVAAARPNRMYVDITRKQVLVRDNADTTDFIWDSWGQDRIRYPSDADFSFLPEDVGRLVFVNSTAARNCYLGAPTVGGNFGTGWHTNLFNFSPYALYVWPGSGYTINGTNNVILESRQGLHIYSTGGQYLASCYGQGTVTQAQYNAGMASAVLPTGVVMSYMFYNSIPPGWVRLVGNSIGNASSGATERANADTWPLYNALWQYMAQDQLPVAGGRGPSSDYDFNRNAYMVLPDMRGRTLFGADLGIGRLTGAAPGGIAGQYNGAAGGEQMHTLTASEIPPHQHYYNSVPLNSTSLGGGPYALNWPPNYVQAATDGGVGVYGYAHNTVPPGVAMGCWIMKL